MLNIGDKAPADPVAQVSNLLDRTPEILSKIKAVFVKDKSEEKSTKEESTEE